MHDVDVDANGLMKVIDGDGFYQEESLLILLLMIFHCIQCRKEWGFAIVILLIHSFYLEEV